MTAKFNIDASYANIVLLWIHKNRWFGQAIKPGDRTFEAFSTERFFLLDIERWSSLVVNEKFRHTLHSPNPK
jgi:hypothetical protein